MMSPADDPTHAALRTLPSVDEVLGRPAVQALLDRLPRTLVVRAVRTVIDRARRRLLAGEGEAPGDGFPELATLEATIARLTERKLRPLINATGIVVHTNLGRSPLGALVRADLDRIAAGYSTLEYNLAEGRRGSRHDLIEDLLREVCGAEAAMVVNNNAAAVMLATSALARGGEVIVSRGELVEIGGSFRIPDVIEQSGARLREVGTTNKTHLRDYRTAAGPDTRALLKVHQSNFAIVGFTEEVSLAELAPLARELGLPLVMDLGSGCLVNLGALGLPHEATPQEALAAGADLVTFSGDKLLGGPQAGLIVGRHELVAQLRSHPLARVVRVGKLTLAALESVLAAYRDHEGPPEQAVPVLAMVLTPLATLRARATELVAQLSGLTGVEIGTRPTISRYGGGSSPQAELPSLALALRPTQVSAAALERQLRAGEPAVVGRIEADTLLLDLRTVLPHQLGELAQAITAAVGTMPSSPLPA